MSKIGFIGLGIMGRPMAGHLLAAGHTLLTVKRDKPLASELADKGMRELDTPAAVAAEAEVIISMVPDTPDVEQVLFGEGGVIEGLLFASRAGADVAKVRESLLGGLAQSKILDVHGERMIQRTFDPGFKIKLHQKDLNLALEGARSLNLALPGTPSSCSRPAPPMAAPTGTTPAFCGHWRSSPTTRSSRPERGLEFATALAQ